MSYAGVKVGGISPLQFYGLPAEKQLVFRKSLERFNLAVNSEKDQRFRELVTHRRQYNEYIKMMATARESKQRIKREEFSKFDEKIRKKVRDF
jgi:hypothetical protein